MSWCVNSDFNRHGHRLKHWITHCALYYEVPCSRSLQYWPRVVSTWHVWMSCHGTAWDIVDGNVFPWNNKKYLLKSYLEELVHIRSLHRNLVTILFSLFVGSSQFKDGRRILFSLEYFFLDLPHLCWSCQSQYFQHRNSCQPCKCNHSDQSCKCSHFCQPRIAPLSWISLKFPVTVTVSPQQLINN